MTLNTTTPTTLLPPWLLPSSLSSLPLTTPALILTLLVLYISSLAVNRLFLSPLSSVPGPRLAALTWLYEFYYDIILGGQYVFKTIDLHKKYGPVVRINPYEVHIGDAEFYSVLYPTTTNKRRDRWAFYARQFGAPGSGVGTVDHNLHRIRRSAINPFFSAQSVRKLQPVITERVDALLRRLHADALGPDRQKPINILYPLSAMTNDIINEYAFARCDHLVEDPSYGASVTDYLLTGTHYGKLMQHASFMLAVVNALPDAVSSALVPGWKGFLRMKRDIYAQIGEIQATQNTEKWQLDVPHATIFHDLLSSKLLPPPEKSTRRLAEEGQVLVQAGTLTSSWALTLATFHLLDQPLLLRRLRDELCAAIPDPSDDPGSFDLPRLEALPLLRAIVKETLRHDIGAAGRSPRTIPSVRENGGEEVVYIDRETGKEYRFSPGTVVSMTAYKTLTDPDIFEDPFAFRPDRWLDGDEGKIQFLERHLTVVFGGGARACLGMWLAQAEIFLTLAKVWRVWGGGGGDGDRREGDVGFMRLYETTARDVRMAADFFIPIPWRGTKGVRVVLESYGE
ncbi:cytochrome P450 CYP542B3 [Echria macrotheca]|uniref:Cytochrome P450 CYP542B3 n=1 Tax=Echria macrotheca TaxID=438768 RepID=A0AAJ0FEU1_9PEZI|nr:cytochrome P450 CYP542B3 [Echria macrotheca]